MDQIRIKKGSSLDLTLTFTEADGSPTSLSGKTFEAQVRDVNWALVDDLVLTAGAEANELVASVQDTSAWPLGALRCDIAIIDGDGQRSISGTFIIHVDRAITEIGA